MIVDILPFRLKLASIEKSAIPRCTHQLMKLVLFPAGPQHFFSYTETDKEVSLILDESHIPGFPEDTLNVCNVIWRAVQIEPGESGLGAVEVVSQVSKPLADINVSIMQISTYDADFTLLPECDLTRALECLSKTFSISNNPLEDIGIQPEELQTWDTTFPMSPTEIHSLQDALSLASATTRGRQSSLMSVLEGEDDSLSPKDRHANGREDSGIGSEETSEPGSGTMSGHGSHVLDTTLQGLNPALISSLTLDADASKKRLHPFQVDFPHRLHITSMEQGLVGQLAIRLLESIFFDNRQTDTTLSIIMDDATMSLFPDHTLNTQAGDWRLIAIGDGPLGFDECGIVTEFSRPLSENGIGLFYLSTFNSDYIMVNDQDFEQAVACLQETAQTVDWKRPSPTSPISPRDSFSLNKDQQHDAKSIRSIDTSSLSGASSDMEAAELSPVSTTADASEIKAEEGEVGEEEEVLPLEESVPA
ncbi:GATS protein-like 3 [Mortierella alpina]|nr:GATS protein-like 3 [Mortierella alpina]